MASTALATPALARDDAWYVGLEGGAMIVEDMDLDIVDTDASHTVDMDYGFDVGGLVGYDFGAFRLEAEASYRRATMDTFTVGTGGISAGAAGSTLAAGQHVDVGGNVDALSFMANGLLDFGPDDGLQGYVGGGAGIGRVGIKAPLSPTGAAAIDDSDSGFAWQVLAGLRAAGLAPVEVKEKRGWVCIICKKSETKEA